MLARKLAHIDLAVTIRPAYDAFAEEICGHLLSYLLDLANCSLYIPPPAAKANDLQPHHHDNFVQNAVLMRMLIARQLLGRWHHRKGVSAGHMSSDFFNVADVRQIDGLLLMDAKMWKEARGTCKSLYMALIAPREVKRQIGEHLRFS